jgi:membrane protein DedA with SNARE-associated domain
MFAVRALISFPVGILQLGYRRFILLTLVGCSLWNGLGISLGYFYGEKVTQILHRMSVGMFVGVFGILILLAGVYFWKTHFAGPAAERSGTS